MGRHSSSRTRAETSSCFICSRWIAYDDLVPYYGFNKQSVFKSCPECADPYHPQLELRKPKGPEGASLKRPQVASPFETGYAPLIGTAYNPLADNVLNPVPVYPGTKSGPDEPPIF